MKFEEVTTSNSQGEQAEQSQPSLFDQVRQSCELVAQESTLVKINHDQVRQFTEKHTPLIKQFLREKLNASSSSSSYPISFDSDLHEVSFHVMYAALQFGSGYRHLLHKYCGRGAAETMVYGLLSMTLSSDHDCFSAMNMSGMTVYDVQNYFQLPVTVDVPLSPNSPIKTERDSELRPLAEQVRSVFNECGRVLRGLRCEQGFGQFVEQCLEEENTPEHLTQQLVKYFPGVFHDVGFSKNGTRVHLMKKVQLVIGELYKAFSRRETVGSNISKLLAQWTRDDISRLTVFVDNVLPAVLVRDQVLQLDGALEERIRNRKLIEAKSPMEVELRAVALHACELIVQESHGEFNAYELDYYLWSLGKEEGYRTFERHATVGTVYY